MNNNQGQQQNSGSDGISATLQVATVITTSDQLIAENIEGKSLFSAPEALAIDVSQAAFTGSSSDDDNSDVEDTSSVNQAGLSSLSNASLTVVAGAVNPSVLSTGNPQINLERAFNAGFANPNGVQALEAVSKTAAEEEAEEASEDKEETEQESEEAAEEESNENIEQDTLSESVVEPLETIFETIAIVEVAALEALTEQAANDLPVIETSVPEFVNINEAPTADPVTAIIEEDGRYSFSASDFGYRDVDGDAMGSVVISTLPPRGSLQLNDTDVTPNQIISVLDISNLSFLPPSDQHGSYGLGFKVSDGRLESQEYTLTMNITPVTDAPMLFTGSSSQLFMTNFQEGTAGWQTDNSSGYLELNPETPYGGYHASNRVVEVEAAYGDDSLYRIVPTEPGKNYQLNFEFSPRQGFPDSTIDVLWDGLIVTTLDGASGAFGWENNSLILLGDGSDKRLEFKATDHNGVGGLLDNIELVELYATGLEDQSAFVGVRASLTDNDGSEQLSLRASELPAGAVLSDGSQMFEASELNTDVDISGWDSSRLMIAPPDNFNGEFDIVYTAITTETDTGYTRSASETVTVTVLPVDGSVVARNDEATASLYHHNLINTEGVLANDSDPDATLSVISVNGHDVAASGYAEIDGLFGILTINAKGQWTYASDVVSSEALQVASESLQNGLAGHWTFDESEGVFLADSSFAGSGQNDTGRLSGGASLNVSGVSGHAVTLNGHTGQVLILDSSDINLQSYLPSRSLSLAFNLDSDNNRTDRQVLYEEGASVNGIVVYIDDGALYAGAYNKTTGWQGDYLSQDISSLSPDTWHHIALVLDSEHSSMMAYLDGVTFSHGTTYGEALSVHSGDISIGGPSPEYDINIFHDGASAGGYFAGSIDDVRIYNRALSEADVQAVRYDFEQLTEAFHYTISNGDSVENALLTINVIQEPFASGNLSDVFAGQAAFASISSSQLIIRGDDQATVTLEGRILSENDFSSIEHWHLFHKGGALDILAETADVQGWSSSFRLFDVAASGQQGETIETVNVDVSDSGSRSVLSLSDLPSGQYLLAVGNRGFSDTDAFSRLDYASSVSGGHDYQLTITGNADVSYLPASVDSYGQIQSQTYGLPEVKIQFTVDLNKENTTNETSYYFELANDDGSLSQGEVTFPVSERSMEITATISNRAWNSISALDDIRVNLHEVDNSGVILASQAFQLAGAATANSNPVTGIDLDDAQDLELLDSGLDMYELIFSQLIDDMQNPLPG